MNRYASKLARSLAPYVPGEQPKIDGLIKLNTNENPYPPAPEVRQALRAVAENARLELYPDPESHALRAAIASHCGVAPENVFVGNGSDEVLALCFLAFFDRDATLYFPDITYSFYPVYSDLFGIPTHRPALREDFTLDVADYADAPGGVLLANPNAPTAIALPPSDIRRLLQTNPHRAVVVDEAYADFCDCSAVELLDEFPNLLVVRTFSKSHSLAGMRLGYALGQPEMIQALDAVKNCFNSYPIDRVAQAVGEAAMRADAYYARTARDICATRDWTTAQLRARGFVLADSAANFVFARHPHQDAALLMAQLRQHKILVRHFAAPRVREYLRITIGLPQQMQALMDALDDIVGA